MINMLLNSTEKSLYKSVILISRTTEANRWHNLVLEFFTDLKSIHSDDDDDESS